MVKLKSSEAFVIAATDAGPSVLFNESALDGSSATSNYFALTFCAAPLAGYPMPGLTPMVAVAVLLAFSYQRPNTFC